MDFGTIAIQVCHDFLSPEPEAIFAQRGAEIFFAPTWGDTAPDRDGTARGETVFRVRARDNGGYLVPSVSDGNSLVIDPMGRILTSSQGRTGVFWAEVDLNRREPLIFRIESRGVRGIIAAGKMELILGSTPMRHPFPLLSIALVLFISLAVCTVLAADKPAISEEARERFVREFHRTGLNTTPGDAMMLRILVESSRARRGVEVGTATGFGAVNMGLAFERNGGELITVDIDPKMVREARENLAKVGLEKTVTAVEGDALKVLPELKGEFDFVFIDALKRDYLKYFQALEPKLKPGAVIVADNVIKSAHDMQDFLDFMQKSPDYHMVIIRASDEKGDGMAVCYKRR